MLIPLHAKLPRVGLSPPMFMIFYCNHHSTWTCINLFLICSLVLVAISYHLQFIFIPPLLQLHPPLIKSTATTAIALTFAPFLLLLNSSIWIGISKFQVVQYLTCKVHPRQDSISYWILEVERWFPYAPSLFLRRANLR